MKPLPSIINVLASATVSIFISCNSGKKTKKENKDPDTTQLSKIDSQAKNNTPPAPPSPTEPPPGVEMLPATLCFENEGLKYALMIRIEYITMEKATVEVISTDLGTNKKTTASFPCEIKNDQLLVKSVAKLPAAGDASEWIPNKNWVIDANKPKQTLLIPFKAKNYETNKWEEMKYSFDPCQ